jgi:hypothetical protein
VEIDLILNFLLNIWLVLEAIFCNAFKFIWYGHGSPFIFTFLSLLAWRIFFVSFLCIIFIKKIFSVILHLLLTF